MSRKPSKTQLAKGLQRLARDAEIKANRLRELGLDEAVRAVNAAAAALAAAAHNVDKK